MLEQMSSAELTEWRAFYQLEAEDEKDRQLARTAISKLR